MLPISGVYEVAIPVANLERAEAFYRDVLGLEVGLRDEPRRWLFLRAGGPNGMLLLQEQTGQAPRHYAFTVRDADLDEAVATLRGKGIVVSDPVTHAWMPARSAYFADPDGHALELCAPLPRR